MKVFVCVSWNMEHDGRLSLSEESAVFVNGLNIIFNVC